MSLLLSLIFSGFVGFLAGMIRRGHGFGLIGNIIVGLFGGFFGNIIFGYLGVGSQEGNLIGSIFVSTGGAVLLLWLIGLFKQK